MSPRRGSDDSQYSMFEGFELPKATSRKAPLKRLQRPLWTEAKALLIARYLYYFVLITKHGTYIDGFSGPQRADHKDLWAAKLVLESDPKRLRNFFFCDKDPTQVQHLRKLVDVQPEVARRTVQILEGDFNEKVVEVLASGIITDSEATFCLLDQRTFECQWETVRRLAEHKKKRKIELFYFLPVGWLNRAADATSDEEALRRWWGRGDVERLLAADNMQKGVLAAERMVDELGYAYAHPWPIYKERYRGRQMYAMVHASDHVAAAKLMRRAYDNALDPPEPMDELQQKLPNLVY